MIGTSYHWRTISQCTDARPRRRCDWQQLSDSAIAAGRESRDIPWRAVTCAAPRPTSSEAAARHRRMVPGACGARRFERSCSVFFGRERTNENASAWGSADRDRDLPLGGQFDPGTRVPRSVVHVPGYLSTAHTCQKKSIIPTSFPQKRRRRTCREIRRQSARDACSHKRRPPARPAHTKAARAR